MKIDFANLARCISGSAYNCAGAIYKAGFGAEAIGFLVMACEVGREALKEVGEKFVGENEFWVALREGLSKRWELLGSCWSKKGDKVVSEGCLSVLGLGRRWDGKGRETNEERTGLTRSPLLCFLFAFTRFSIHQQQSHSSLISAILALPPSTFSLLSTLSSKSSLSEVFLHPDLVQLAALIVRVTIVAVLDLSLPPSEVSLHSYLSPGMDTTAMGAILEHQVAALEGLGSSSSLGGASTASVKVIEDALGVYEGSEFPVRRIR